MPDRDPETHAALAARDAHKAPQRFDAEPSQPSCFGALGCDPREYDRKGHGRLAPDRGSLGEELDEADGSLDDEDNDDLPLSETRKCARCDGRGEVYRPATRLYEYAVSPDDLGGYFECPECGGEGVFLIDDECDQGPQFDAPGHPGARYTWGGR